MADINDNAPIATPSYAEYEVYEMAEGGLPLVTFVAGDADSGSNGQLALSVAEVSSVKAGKEKYEFTVVVSVTDHGAPSKSVKSTIVVRGPAVCSGSSFIMDQSTLQLKIVSAAYFIDEGTKLHRIERCTYNCMNA